MSGSRSWTSMLLGRKRAEDLPMGRDEKAALKRAEEAERAFRASKGYEPDTFWNRLKRRFRKK